MQNITLGKEKSNYRNTTCLGCRNDLGDIVDHKLNMSPLYLDVSKWH